MVHDSDAIKRFKFLSVMSAVLWLVLAAVAAIIASYLSQVLHESTQALLLAARVLNVLPPWGWASLCAFIGIANLFHERWRAPLWILWVFWILGVFIWAYLLVMGFIAPHFDFGAPLVDR